ncbi:glutamate synthase subunit alpha, partial [Acidimicrobiaceae bacterium USS-CC1]|nr:glutamate synthase subunit alpha [Acidiferrimicrobium australe]
MALTPPRSGLYEPTFEHDACGVAFVVDVHGRRSHRLIQLGLRALCNLEHRGASGAEADTGDGAGILLQVPDALYREVAGVALPPPGAYGTGIGFLPTGDAARREATAGFERIAAGEGLQVLAWREVPVLAATLGPTARRTMPALRQPFVAAADGAAGLALERRLWFLRK